MTFHRHTRDRSGRRDAAVAVALGLVVFAVLVLAYGRCAAWDVTAPPPPRCSP